MAEAPRNTTRVHYSGTTSPKSANPSRRFVTVEVEMPHLARYGKPTLVRLTYGATFEVRLGQQVLCPPTRLSAGWMRGRIVDLNATGYEGPVKYVVPLGRRADRAGA